MSRIAGPPDNRDTVLTAIGRASTPAVAKFDAGPSLGTLTRAAVGIAPGSVLLVGAKDSETIIRKSSPVVIGIPGMLTEQADQKEIESFVIDSAAFDSGPWIGADDHQSRHMAEELFEAGRILRSRGGQCWLIPRPTAGGSMTARLRSTATADLADIPAVDLEEGASQSPLWTALVDLASQRFPDGSDPQSDRKDAMTSHTFASHPVRIR